MDVQVNEVKIKSKKSSIELQANLPQQIEVKGATNKIAPYAGTAAQETPEANSVMHDTPEMQPLTNSLQSFNK